MAEVYEAVATLGSGLERRVAVKKLIDAHASDARLLAMFLDEARIASQLSHANILAVLDFGVVEGVPFQVIDFVDGDDASALRRLGEAAGDPLPVAACLYIVMEVAHALQSAHSARDPSGAPLGVVHRDVSPRNVLVSWQGEVKLADFGIAFANERSERTATGVIKGTPAYMAPEQTLGARVGPETDIFALGCVLHSLLTGQSPLSDPENVIRLLSGSAPLLDDELSADVRSLVERCVRARREERFASARDVAAAVSDMLRDRHVSDARAALVGWLDRNRPRNDPSDRVPGALDALLLPQLAFQGEEPIVDGDRTRTLRVFAPDRSVDRATGPEPRPDELLAGAQPREPRRFRRRGGAIALAAGALASLVAGTALYKREAPRGGHVAAPPDAAAIASAAAVPPLEVAPLDVAPLDVVPAANAPAGAPVRAPAGARLAVRTTASPPSTASLPHSVPSASTPRSETTPPERGVVRIGGEGALRARIIVDGISRGYAPKELLLPVGRHSVALVGANDAQVASTQITVSVENTQSNPVVWQVAR